MYLEALAIRRFWCIFWIFLGLFLSLSVISCSHEYEDITPRESPGEEAKDPEVEKSRKKNPSQFRTVQDAGLLSCSVMQRYIEAAFKTHYSYTRLEDDFHELMALDVARKFIDSLDPSSTIFSKEKAHNLVLSIAEQSKPSLYFGSCKFLEEFKYTYQNYGKSYVKRSRSAIKSTHNFSTEESMWISKGNVLPFQYLNVNESLEERARKEAKLWILDMRLHSPYLEDDEIQDFLLMRQRRLKYFFDNLSNQHIFAAFLRAVGQSLDPHSTFFANFKFLPYSTNRSLGGGELGHYSLGVDFDFRYGYAHVRKLSDEALSVKDGLQVDDEIIGVYSAKDNKTLLSLEYMTKDEFYSIITSYHSDPISLEVLRPVAGSAVSFTRFKLTVDRLPMTQPLHRRDLIRSSLMESENGTKVGVLKINHFYDSAAHGSTGDLASDSVSELFDLFMQGMESLVIDLRHNNGGSTKAALKFLYLFMDPKVAFQVSGLKKSKEQEEFILPVRGKRGKFFQKDIPLVVLVSKASASASELFAQAIKVHGRGIVVGDSRTFGKATLQRWLNGMFSDVTQEALAMSVSVGKYYGADGLSVQGTGVSSDVVIPSLSGRYLKGEDEFGNALDRSVVTSKASSLPSLSRSVSLLKMLKEKSQARTTDSEYFQAIRSLSYPNKRSAKQFFSLEDKTDVLSKVQRLMYMYSLYQKPFSEVFDEHMHKAVFGTEDTNPYFDDLVLQEAVNITADYSNHLNVNIDTVTAEEDTEEDTEEDIGTEDIVEAEVTNGDESKEESGETHSKEEGDDFSKERVSNESDDASGELVELTE
ncbi:MAG: S41 family peptidase [Proteobacteria bacterium]|nr:S41 family peptidase [Pseudomonadota bacterium]